MIDNEKANNLLDSCEWVWSKSYEKTFPHWYSLRKSWTDKDFVDVVLFIRQSGKEEQFYKKKYIYYYHGGYKYWTMGFPVHNCNKTGTILINRARL